ncbi:hypothetical protein JQ620_15320 [Bradyrhizobium sp. AUGA SZCCT0274]|uniref:hypothetical protein n=1 Tax=Bradyrhizobium sp. AUGA SZCCT0274 TaxID=2807670 RepID=UPI001BAAF4AA|nr:hypothetical protein [Bradyrhizobium sp. AUGA SZCCT0274]MBR1241499.1 hypothetical protein [Bradyrhizobium sp. AUGA SZCCT0274]
MSKRKHPVTKKTKPVIRPYNDADPAPALTEWEHYALECARLLHEVHQTILRECERRGFDDETVVVTRGMVVLGLKHPDTYRAIAQNKEARETVKTIRNASQTINDALGLTYGVQVNGGDNPGMFGITVY